MNESSRFLDVDHFNDKMSRDLVFFDEFDCRRTGTVVIPLLCALYDIDYKTASKHVVQQTCMHRITDIGHRCEMPETEEQVAVARRVEPLVRKRTR